MSKGWAELWLKRHGRLGKILSMDHKCTGPKGYPDNMVKNLGQKRGHYLSNKKLLRHSSLSSYHSEFPRLAISRACHSWNKHIGSLVSGLLSYSWSGSPVDLLRRPGSGSGTPKIQGVGIWVSLKSSHSHQLRIFWKHNGKDKRLGVLESSLISVITRYVPLGKSCCIRESQYLNLENVEFLLH